MYQAAPPAYKKTYENLIKQQLIHMKKVDEILKIINNLSLNIEGFSEKIKNTTKIELTEAEVKEITKEMNINNKEFNKIYSKVKNLSENIDEDSAIEGINEEIDEDFAKFMNSTDETTASTDISNANDYLASLNVMGILPTVEPPKSEVGGVSIPIESKMEEKKEVEVDFDY